MVRDEAKDKNLQIEMGWVGEDTGGRHEIIPKDVGFLKLNYFEKYFLLLTSALF